MSSFFQTLPAFGWTPERNAEFELYRKQGLEPARVVCELRRKFYAVQSQDAEILAQCPGKFFHHTLTQSEFPAIGDWLAIKRRPNEARAEIHSILPRRTKLSRRAAGEENIEQIIATNIDVLFLVSSLDQSLNLTRLQRFLVAARGSGAAPVIVLNKVDLCRQITHVLQEVSLIAREIPIYPVSTKTRRGLKLLSQLLIPGKTFAFIGPSGTGKSSLINRFMGEQSMPTGEVREKDSKGRHTTTRRELVLTPSGAILIDTPGMRELQLWSLDEGIQKSFPDILQLALQCKFTNCRHENEPGCAIQAALANGLLPHKRWSDYKKLTESDMPTNALGFYYQKSRKRPRR